MKRIVVAVVVLVACSRKQEPAAQERAGSTVGSSATSTGSAIGSSATGSASGSAAGAAAPAPQPPGPAALAARYDACAAFWSTSAWTDYASCFAANAKAEDPGGPIATGVDQVVAWSRPLKEALPDAKREPTLELVNGHRLVAIDFVHGTQNGHKAGVLVAHLVEADDAGKLAYDGEYYDLSTLYDQLGVAKADRPVRAPYDKAPLAKAVIVATGDAAEQSNVDVVTKLWAAYDKHDAKSVGALLAADLAWSAQANANDRPEAELLKAFQTSWQRCRDLAAPPGTTWAAGAYVARTAVATCTDKDHTKIELPFLAIHELATGEVKKVWLFGQHVPAHDIP